MACPNVDVKRGRAFAMKCRCETCTALRAAAARPGQLAAAAARPPRVPGVPRPPYVTQPLAWHDEPDEIAVGSVLMGHRMQLAAADRLEVVRIATARGESAAQIATRLRVSERTVCRYRARLAA